MRKIIITIIIALAACTTPSTTNNMPHPGRDYGDLYGATGAETCAALADRLCSGSQACVAGYAQACSAHADALVAAPTRDAWEGLWRACDDEIARDSFGFECVELMP